MEKRPVVLVIDDDRTVREALTSTLDEVGYDVVAAEGLQRGREVLATRAVDAVLLDIRLRDGDGLTLLAELRRERPRVPVLMATAYGDSDRTIAAMKLGAFEYVTKPFDLAVLLAALRRAVLRPPVARPQEGATSATLIGNSPEMLSVWKAIGRAAASTAPVLLTGESGVGKDLVARAIHQHSERREGPFVPVNIAALPASLVGSELFGHEKGAFTGASGAREGRFEQATQGTLFLDEIGDLDAALQTYLLRVLEDGCFERVGGNARIQTGARIIAATSREVTPGRPGASVREDLFYRLSVVRIDVPPLRKRRGDIPLLADAFLRRAPGRRALSEAALELLMEHPWPGNVRQLAHVLESAWVMSAAEVLDVEDLLRVLPDAGVPSASERAVPDELDLRANLDALERKLLAQALVRARGNRAHAARLLGIRRAQLYARLRALGMETGSEG